MLFLTKHKVFADERPRGLGLPPGGWGRRLQQRRNDRAGTVTCAYVTSETGSDFRGRSRLLGRSATTNPFGGGALSVKPPEKGVFPLDRQGTCKKQAHEFLACLDQNQQDYSACKELSKMYLQCRMDKNLMQKEELDKLGFKDGDDEGDQTKGRRAEIFYDGKREVEGFVGGTGVKSSGKGFFK